MDVLSSNLVINHCLLKKKTICKQRKRVDQHLDNFNISSIFILYIFLENLINF